MTAPNSMVVASHPLRPGRYIWLYAIQLQVTATTATQAGINQWVLLAASNENITFNSLTYYAYPIEHDDFEADSEGNLPTSRLRIANFRGLVGGYLRTYGGLAGMRVVITLVKESLIGTPAHAVSEEFDIQSADVNSAVATLSLGQGKLLQLPFPPHRLLRNGCRFRYKGGECGYVSHVENGVTVSDETCDLTLDGPNGCAGKLNEIRFGGFANIPQFI